MNSKIGAYGGPVGAIITGTIDLGINTGKVGYYTTTSFYNYGVGESVSNWWEVGYNPIDYYFGK